MEFKDLEKKLESIKVPEIEIQSHKERLKMALLNSGYFKEEKIMNPIMFWTKRLVPAGIALALILAIGFSVIQPKLQIARAMEIAKKDPQIQQLMKDYGLEIKQVKVQDGKAYVLLALPEEKLPSELEKRALGGEETGMRGPGQMFMAYQNPETGEIIEFSGSVAEIDLKAAKVANLKQVGIVEPVGEKGPAIGKYTGELKKIKAINVAPLTEEEKARAIEIAKSEPKIQEMIPDLEQREVIVKPLPPLKLRLDEDPDNGIRVSPANPNEEKRVNVIFKSERRQDIITVNLTTGKVEGAVSFSTGKTEKPQSEYPVPIKPNSDEGVVIMEQENEGLTANQKEVFAQMLKDIAQKDERIKDLLKDNDYEILEVIRSKPIVEKTETSETIRVETATVVLEKESTGKKYWITIDLGTNTVKSIKG
ncbi:hypothetical protein J7J18_02800, partial [bacterium]|nr:hypothetical protein [bacterium]